MGNHPWYEVHSSVVPLPVLDCSAGCIHLTKFKSIFSKTLLSIHVLLLYISQDCTRTNVCSLRSKKQLQTVIRFLINFFLLQLCYLLKKTDFMLYVLFAIERIKRVFRNNEKGCTVLLECITGRKSWEETFNLWVKRCLCLLSFCLMS